MFSDTSCSPPLFKGTSYIYIICNGILKNKSENLKDFCHLIWMFNLLICMTIFGVTFATFILCFFPCFVAPPPITWTNHIFFDFIFPWSVYHFTIALILPFHFLKENHTWTCTSPLIMTVKMEDFLCDILWAVYA